jgi:adenylylsulfate kinase-like enzyme
MTDDPKITLAGREYAIPKLAIKQNRHVEILVARNRDYFARRDQKGLYDLTEEQAEDFQKIIYHYVA